MDVKNSFLQGGLHEEIYMNKPEGYTSDPSLVCKLQKSLYGLKHAPRSGYAKIDPFLLSQNFRGENLIQIYIYSINKVIL